MSLGRLQELNDAECGAFLSLITPQNGRVTVNVEPTTVDEARLTYQLPQDAVLAGFLQHAEDGEVEEVIVRDGTELCLGASALSGVYTPSTMYGSGGYVPNLDTGGRTYLHRLSGYLYRTRLQEQIVVPWETDEIYL